MLFCFTYTINNEHYLHIWVIVNKLSISQTPVHSPISLYMYMSEKYSPRPLGTSVDLYCEGAGINAPFTVYLQNVIAENEKALPAERLRNFH